MSSLENAGVEPLPRSVASLLEAFESGHPGCRLCLWAGDEEGWVRVYPPAPDGQERPETPRASGRRVPFKDGIGVKLGAEGPIGDEELAFLVEILGRLLDYEREARLAARELTERYEEINLLYSITEILSSVISMQSAGDRILAEVADVLGARRASLWLYDPASRRLNRVGGFGEIPEADVVDIDDAASLTARVFRERQPLNLEQGTVLPRGAQLEARPKGEDAVLAVPITYSPPEGQARTVGVIALVGRRSNVRFSAGDARLLSAIASQVGAALETQRLMQESLQRQRIVHELELAHNLQLKLLPETADFEGTAEVSARCAPADSVGGDFYHLFRLSGDRLGVVIGDVSSHGFGAALIMALAMSAIAISAQEAGEPAEVLRRVHRALIDELESTEMYVTIFYGVIDRRAGRLIYANAGHPHAFRVDAGGRLQRLGATNPPLGMLPIEEYSAAEVEWHGGRDLLCLFTDGLSDTFDPRGGAGGEGALVAEVIRLRDRPTCEILEALFERMGRDVVGIPPDDRTAVLLR